MFLMTIATVLESEKKEKKNFFGSQKNHFDFREREKKVNNKGRTFTGASMGILYFKRAGSLFPLSIEVSCFLNMVNLVRSHLY